MINHLVLFIRVEPDGVALVLTLTAVIIAFAACVWSLIGVIVMNKKPGILHIHDSSLELYGRRIEGETIEAIWVRGYFRPKYGLKRRGRSSKTLLMQDCFRMRDGREEDACSAALEQWAERQGIPVRNKLFSTRF
jgi:hypothetical protein